CGSRYERRTVLVALRLQLLGVVGRRMGVDRLPAVRRVIPEHAQRDRGDEAERWQEELRSTGAEADLPFADSARPDVQPADAVGCLVRIAIGVTRPLVTPARLRAAGPGRRREEGQLHARRVVDAEPQVGRPERIAELGLGRAAGGAPRPGESVA